MEIYHGMPPAGLAITLNLGGFLHFKGRPRRPKIDHALGVHKPAGKDLSHTQKGVVQCIASDEPEIQQSVIDLGPAGEVDQTAGIGRDVACNGDQETAFPGLFTGVCNDVDAFPSRCIPECERGVVNDPERFFPALTRLDAVDNVCIQPHSGPEQEVMVIADTEIHQPLLTIGQLFSCLFESEPMNPIQPRQSEFLGPNIGRPGGEHTQRRFGAGQHRGDLSNRSITPDDEDSIGACLDGFPRHVRYRPGLVTNFQMNSPTGAAKYLRSSPEERCRRKPPGGGIVDHPACSIAHVEGHIIAQLFRLPPHPVEIRIHSMETAQSSILGGRYQILELLGQGGMATVFRARDLNLQRDVALKILRDTLITDPGFRDRFLQEARAAANLSHPNIVTVFDFGQDNDQLFLVMEYVPGTDLKTLLRRHGRLPIQEAVDLMIKICSGVGYAHRAGLVHCDLKPHNILVTADNQAKITDFGIARALAAIDPDEHSAVVWGSPLYFAPEQASGGPPSPASDVYSLGVILYEMLTGQPPFQADDSSKLAEMHLTRNPPSPSKLNPDIPPALEEILLKVLSKEPANRYRTADQFGRILRRFAAPAAAESDPFQAISPAVERSSANAHTMAMDAPVREDVDWTAILLGLLAFLAIGGLIPLWLWVCLLYPSCPLNP